MQGAGARGTAEHARTTTNLPDRCKVPPTVRRYQSMGGIAGQGGAKSARTQGECMQGAGARGGVSKPALLPTYQTHGSRSGAKRRYLQGRTPCRSRYSEIAARMSASMVRSCLTASNLKYDR